MGLSHVAEHSLTSPTCNILNTTFRLPLALRRAPVSESCHLCSANKSAQIATASDLAPSLGTLPLELITPIVDQLHDERPVGLICLALTSHYFHDLITAIINEPSTTYSDTISDTESASSFGYDGTGSGLDFDATFRSSTSPEIQRLLAQLELFHELEPTVNTEANTQSFSTPSAKPTSPLKYLIDEVKPKDCQLCREKRIRVVNWFRLKWMARHYVKLLGWMGMTLKSRLVEMLEARWKHFHPEWEELMEYFRRDKAE